MKASEGKTYENKPSLGNTVTIELLAEYLIDYSSAEKLVSIKEICHYFDEKIEFASEKNMNLSSLDDSYEAEFLESFSAESEKFVTAQTTEKQVKRLLARYLDKRLIAGFCIRSKKKLSYKAAKNGGKSLEVRINERTFYIERPFDEMSINLLRDALEVFPYAETYLTYDIISGLNKLTPLYNRREFIPDMVSAVKYKGTYFDNLEKITRAFSVANKGYVSKLAFVYCQYDENKTLVERPSSDGSLERIVNPVKIMWANGFYYLVTVIEKEKKSDTFSVGDVEYIYINYRIDRMKNVRCLDEKAKIPPVFSPDVYRTKNPVMYSERGQETNCVTILCNKSLINNVLDTFGFDVELSPAEKESEIIVTVRGTSLNGVKMWALEYGEKCVVLGPPALVNMMKNAAVHLAELYCKD